MNRAHANLIDGIWNTGGTSRCNINPSDLDDTIGEYVHASPNEVDVAVQAAYAAQPKWARIGAGVRSDALDRIGTELIQRADELGQLLAREEGKTLKEAQAEATRAGQLFKFFAGEALRLSGETLAPLREGVDVEIMRTPVGVVGLITPWNFPLGIPAWKIAPALAFGNAVVFKPADLVPGSAWALAEIIQRSGIPPGVFNMVVGGADVGEAIIAHPRINAVSFTGSVHVGESIARAVMGRGVALQLELGGKNALLVMDDAKLDVAVEAAVNGSYFSCGQRCTASSRLVVTAGIHDAFVDALTQRVKQLRIGHALDRDIDLGPLASEIQFNNALKYVAIGQSEGAQLLTGGAPLERKTRGYYLSPALFARTDNTMRINREEIFGPVASVIEVVDLDEAISVANDSDFGLSAGIVTSDPRKAGQFKQTCNAGMLSVNLPTAGMDLHAPMTGRKRSSFGPPEKGSYARDFYTAIKVVHQQWV
jgi:aldehyde dehydrogenase (NAD+)